MLVTAVSDAWDQAVSVKKEENGLDLFPWGFDHATKRDAHSFAALTNWVGCV